MILVKDGEIEKSSEYEAGFTEGLRRIAGLTEKDKSLDRLRALLIVFRASVKELEAEISRREKKLPKTKLKLL